MGVFPPQDLQLFGVGRDRGVGKKRLDFGGPGERGLKPRVPHLLLRRGSRVVALAEAFHASGGIDQFLLTRKKRMALGTDFDMDIRFRGPGFERITTRTRDLGELVVWMYTGFHWNNSVMARIQSAEI
jgi:hypothetical protein